MYGDVENLHHGALQNLLVIERKERCISWGRCAASADIMTKFLRLPNQHPLVELLCADGGDCVNVRDPISHISLPEPLLGGLWIALSLQTCEDLTFEQRKRDSVLSPVRTTMIVRFACTRMLLFLQHASS